MNSAQRKPIRSIAPFTQHGKAHGVELEQGHIKEFIAAAGLGRFALRITVASVAGPLSRALSPFTRSAQTGRGCASFGSPG